MLKKYLSIFYFVILVFTSIIRLEAQHITGSGTQLDPYILYNAADFDSIRYIGSYYNTSYKFGNDIDFTGFGNFTPIDSVPHMLDGDGYVLSNLEISTTTSRQRNSIFGYGRTGVTTGDTIRNIVFSFNKVTVNNFNGTFSSDTDIWVSLLVSHQNYLKTINCIFYKNEIIIYGRQTSVAGNDIDDMVVGMAYASETHGGALYFCSAIENKIYINGRIQNGSEIGGLMGIRSGAAAYLSSKRNSIYFKNHLAANINETFIGSIEGRTYNTSGSLMFSYEDTIRIVTPGTYSTYRIGGIAGFISKGSIIGVNPVWSNMYSRTIVLLDSLGYSAGNGSHPLFPAINAINLSSLYADTSFYNDDYPQPDDIITAVYCDSTDLRDSTFLTDFNFATTWDMDLTGNWGYFPIFQTGMPTVIVPPDIIPAAVDLLYPNGEETFYYPDTVNITFTTNTDTHYVYYSLNDGSSWTFLDTVLVDTSSASSGSYSWNIPDNTSLQVRVKVQRDTVEADSSLAAFYIIGSGSTIDILSASLSGETITALIESNYVDTLYVYHGLDTTLTMDLVASGIVDPGDGNYPDTTIFTWNISDLPAATQMFIKATTNNSLNITSADYSDSLRNSGRSGYYVSAQAPIFHSNVFVSSGQYYRISWKAELWGWYDYSDRIGVWKFNKTTLVWDQISSTFTDGVFYPKLNGYRSADGFVITNKSLTSPRYFISPTTTVAQDFGSRQEGTFPASIDQSNHTTAYGSWIYTASGNDVIASDILTGASFTFITDARISPIELVVIDNDWLMVTRNVITGQGGEPYSWIYPLLRTSIAFAYDIYSMDLIGSRTRNYLRGVYPNAIIEYYPPIR